MNKTPMREVATLFDDTESSVHRMLIRVTDYILTLGPTVITFPSDLNKLSQGFEKVSIMEIICKDAIIFLPFPYVVLGFFLSVYVC